MLTGEAEHYIARRCHMDYNILEQALFGLRDALEEGDELLACAYASRIQRGAAKIVEAAANEGVG